MDKIKPCSLLFKCIIQSTCRDANKIKLEGTSSQGQGKAGQGRHNGQRLGLLMGPRVMQKTGSIQEGLAGIETEMRAWSLSEMDTQPQEGPEAGMALLEDRIWGIYRLSFHSSTGLLIIWPRNIFPTRIRQIKHYRTCLWGEMEEWKEVRKS